MLAYRSTPAPEAAKMRNAAACGDDATGGETEHLKGTAVKPAIPG
jgi:hypothetical protein